MIYITKVMMEKFNITDLDFMGYSLKMDNASYHHLVIPRRNNGCKSLLNGAVLNKETSHPYLHLIEKNDYELFYLITKVMINEVRLGRLDEKYLKQIDDYLNVFEKEHSGDCTTLGNPLIKEEYVNRLIIK